MMFEKYQKCEIFMSDGIWTVGYVGGGKPAIWNGNTTTLKKGDWYSQEVEGAYFGVNCQDEFTVKDGEWVACKDEG